MSILCLAEKPIVLRGEMKLLCHLSAASCRAHGVQAQGSQSDTGVRALASALDLLKTELI